MLRPDQLWLFRQCYISNQLPLVLSLPWTIAQLLLECYLSIPRFRDYHHAVIRKAKAFAKQQELVTTGYYLENRSQTAARHAGNGAGPELLVELFDDSYTRTGSKSTVVGI